MSNRNNYYLGLDVGTDSVGYAVTDERYLLMKHKGDPMWGVHLFDPAEINDKRRGFRSARRRIDRRQQRVRMVQEIFAVEIAKTDENFFRRIKESALWRDDAHDAHCLFCDSDYTDADYYRQYPTVHHLICDLINNTKAHDVRLVYLACAWLVAHRGHFFSEVSKDHLDDVLNFELCYQELMELFSENPLWDCEAKAFGEILKKKIGVSAKYKELCILLFHAPKAPKMHEVEEDETYYSIEHILKLLCGGKVSAKDIFNKEEYAEIASFTLDKSDDELAQILSELGDDAELIRRLKAVFDWAVLADILSDSMYISAKKVALYEQHKTDLALLKKLVRKYVPSKYQEVFRDESKAGYAHYRKSGKSEDFCQYIKSIFKDIHPETEDAADFAEILGKLDAQTLCPKQVTSDNRVIPYQVYWAELKQILENSSAYLPFLNEADADGYVAKDKLLSIMEFRVPYYVGPLNSASSLSWFERKADGKITLWNFEEKVDLDKSEQNFIDRMTNTCTYLPYADVMPKCALLHEKFQVLNEINTLSVHGQRITVDLKQKIYTDLFAERKKVTAKSIKQYLVRNGFYTESDLDTLGGIDETVKSSLSSYLAFKRLLSAKQLTETDVEAIIERSTYTEDRLRFAEWINKKYPMLSDEDRKYVTKLKFKDFARLSETLLRNIFGTEKGSETGEAMSIIDRMWNENLNLMEILSDRYTYRSVLQAEAASYYQEHPKNIDERMKEMCISNAVKRPIIRAMDIVSDVVKVNGGVPQKIFVEMARGGTPDNKGKRTKSRYQQLKELYAKCDSEDVRDMEARLDAMGDDRDNRLQGEKLFLYYLQLGRSMYSGKVIELEQLSSKSYDIDHIYPQCKVKDDSVLNNKVLVLSEENGAKGDKYPIAEDVRHHMQSWWKLLLDNGFITPEKYKRLTRHTPFDEDEEWGFINRQLVETRQSTKALATLLKERYPEAEIVYVKAGIVSEFRQEFDMLKCRAVNDLHHAKDAYLNIVVGNVYNGQFTHRWFLENKDTYNIKVETLFNRRVTVGSNVIWDGKESIGKIKNTVQNKNAIHMTQYAFCRKGGFFDQQPKAYPEGAIPRKQGLPVEKYGGYCKPTASFFALAKYRAGKDTNVMLVPVDLLSADKFVQSSAEALKYTEETIACITGKHIDSVEFPLGLKPIKINTMLDFDGMKMCIAGKSSGGRTVIPSLTMPLVISYPWEKYVKHLERFTEKKKDHPSMIYNEAYDKITVEKNIELYDLLIQKLGNPPYEKRPNNPIETLRNGREKFAKLDIAEQAKFLMQILTVFGRSSGGCDLRPVGGVGKAAVVSISSSLSNWKKKYTDVRIIDQSASGLFEKRSECNLLDLL